jgi:hypothetical protein
MKAIAGLTQFEKAIAEAVGEGDRWCCKSLRRRSLVLQKFEKAIAFASEIPGGG